jgi:hypothetical protein
MEVHHHSHAHGKNNWKAYFWEFLMLFLAVFCGFLAEYQLEHKIEKDREKQYMTSMLQDLKEDSFNMDKIIRQNRLILLGLDTLAECLQRKMTAGNIDSTYAYSIKYRYDAPFVDFSERTMSQLKNSGGLRLIRNQKVSDALARYDQGIRACDVQKNMVIFYYHSLEESEKIIFDFGSVKPLWDKLLTAGADTFAIKTMLSYIKGKVNMRTTNPAAINKYIDEIIYDQVAVGGYANVQLADQLKRSTLLIELIKKEYHIE